MADPPPQDTPADAGDSPTAAIVLIGNELLSGKVEDENGRFLIAELRKLGVELREMRLVSDRVPHIAEAVRDLSARWDHVFTSGGVGPTHDDITMSGVAAAFDVELSRNSGLAERIQEQFKGDASKVEAWLKMADVPEGCSLLYLSDVWWPIYVMHNVFVLPGIPEIFRRQFSAIQERFQADRYMVRTLYLRSGEGALAAPLTRVAQEFPSVMLGSYPVLNVTDYRVRVTLESKSRQDLEAAFHSLLTEVPRQEIYKVVDG